MGIYISLCASCCHPCQRGRPWTNPTNPPVSDFSEIFFTCFLNIKSFIIVGFLYGFLVLFSWSLVFKRKSKFRCVWTVAVHISEPGHAWIVFCLFLRFFAPAKYFDLGFQCECEILKWFVFSQFWENSWYQKQHFTVSDSISEESWSETGWTARWGTLSDNISIYQQCSLTLKRRVSDQNRS